MDRMFGIMDGSRQRIAKNRHGFLELDVVLSPVGIRLGWRPFEEKLVHIGVVDSSGGLSPSNVGAASSFATLSSAAGPRL